MQRLAAKATKMPQTKVIQIALAAQKVVLANSMRSQVARAIGIAELAIRHLTRSIQAVPASNSHKVDGR